MNWKREAIEDLRRYSARKRSVENLQMRLNLLEEQYISLRGVSASEPVMGGVSKQEEMWIQNISEREKLRFSLKIALELTALTEKGLEVLDERELEIIRFFYIEPRSKNVDEICRKLFLEKSRVYQIKDEAIRKFVTAEYGAVEI